MGKLLKIGLALGGGGARGLAHIGVLCALEREKIPVDFLVGTSMGALVASVYALTPQCDAVLERFQRYLESEEFRRTNPEFLHEHDYELIPTLEGIFHRFASFIKKGFFYSQSLAKKAPISEENFTRNIGFLVDDVDMEKTRIPLAVVSLDLKSGEEVVLKEGSLRKAVSASCAIPGILPPVSMGDRELVDGGWVNRVPVRPTREMGADLVIAVDVAEGLTDPGDLNKGLDIVLRTYDICQHTLSQWQLREADVVLRPDLSGLHWSDFGHFEDCLRAGQDSVRKNLEEIKKAIRRKKIKKILCLPERFRPLR